MLLNKSNDYIPKTEYFLTSLAKLNENSLPPKTGFTAQKPQKTKLKRKNRDEIILFRFEYM